MRTHIIRHPYMQDHKKLARVYQQMATAIASQGITENISETKNTLQFMADEHRRKAKIAGRRGAKFIFYK